MMYVMLWARARARARVCVCVCVCVKGIGLQRSKPMLSSPYFKNTAHSIVL